MRGSVRFFPYRSSKPPKLSWCNLLFVIPPSQLVFRLKPSKKSIIVSELSVGRSHLTWSSLTPSQFPHLVDPYLRFIIHFGGNSHLAAKTDTFTTRSSWKRAKILIWIFCHENKFWYEIFVMKIWIEYQHYVSMGPKSGILHLRTWTFRILDWLHLQALLRFKCKAES